MAIDQRERGEKPLASINHDELQSLIFQPPLIQIIQKPFPG
jgi:hypothetical protein